VSGSFDENDAATIDLTGGIVYRFYFNDVLTYFQLGHLLVLKFPLHY
jgi:hypothetical protein